MTTTIKSLLDYTLNLWVDICDILYGATKEDQMKKKKLKLADQITHCYSQQDTICHDFLYLCDYNLGDLCSRSTQYMIKWLETMNLTGRNRGQGRVYNSTA